MTLIELLITVLIISILAGALLGVAAVAGETAREATSRHMVARLHTLLMEHLDTYKSRRIKLRMSNGGAMGIKDLINSTITRATAGPTYVRRRGEALQEARLYALREMMLMEVPDRWSDVYLNALDASDPGVPYFLEGRTELSSVYLRRYQRLLGRTNTLTGVANTLGDIRQNQGAECLYQVIITATADGEARSLFGESSIGDTDGDGAREFLDGWGHPISFLRWAPGFDSDIQINANQFGAVTDPNTDPDWVNAANGDHDPYDLFRVEPAAFRLVPLIYSAGRDEELGVVDANTADTYVPWGSSAFSSISVNISRPYFTIASAPALFPYVLVPLPGLPAAYLGTRLDLLDPGQFEATAVDNIHNHLLGQR